LTIAGDITCSGITCNNSVVVLYVRGSGSSLFTGKIGVSNLLSDYPITLEQRMTIKKYRRDLRGFINENGINISR
jgi:hypothetical protein